MSSLLRLSARFVVRAAARSRGRVKEPSGRRSLSSPPMLERAEVFVEQDGVAAVRRIVEAKGQALAAVPGVPPGQGEALQGVGLPPLVPGARDLGEPELQATPSAGAASAPSRSAGLGGRRKRAVPGHRSPVELQGPMQSSPASPTAWASGLGL